MYVQTCTDNHTVTLGSSIFCIQYIYIYYRIICYTCHIYKYHIICGHRGLPCGLYNLYNSGNSGCQTMFVIGQEMMFSWGPSTAYDATPFAVREANHIKSPVLPKLDSCSCHIHGQQRLISGDTSRAEEAVFCQ